MYYIGIDVGGTYIKAGLIDENGHILERAMLPTVPTRDALEIVADMSRAAQEVVQKAGISMQDIKSVGVGIPGACDDVAGTIIYTANIPFKNVPLRAEMGRVLHVPVHVGNDANCAALGEYHMLGGGVRDLIFVTLGTGVGGGLILNGKLYTGFNGIAGEIGHIMLVRDGEYCNCGRHGCWEAYASVTALIRQTKAYAVAHPDSAVAKACGADFANATGKTSFELAKAGDAGGNEIVQNWISYVACGITDMINIFQPQLLLIGGAISKEGDYLLRPIQKIVNEDMYKSDVPHTDIRIAALGNDAGLIGAAFLA